jgi:hypothetical protein
MWFSPLDAGLEYISGLPEQRKPCLPVTLARKAPRIFSALSADRPFSSMLGHILDQLIG